jgi:tRNA-Thr(GGU) m(6)t(6)A37 methyltransferase TsaA
MEITRRELHDFKDRKFPEKICFKPIGIIHTPFKSLKGIPIQFGQSDVKGTIEIFPQFISALKDLDGFSCIYCLYLFDMVKLPIPLHSKPFLDNTEHGVFAIRTPFRPNPIGLSIFEISRVENGNIHVNNVDVLDKTPILDIKPYIPQFDAREAKKIGWIQGKIKTKLS